MTLHLYMIITGWFMVDYNWHVMDGVKFNIVSLYLYYYHKVVSSGFFNWNVMDYIYFKNFSLYLSYNHKVVSSGFQLR